MFAELKFIVLVALALSFFASITTCAHYKDKVKAAEIKHQIEQKEFEIAKAELETAAVEKETEWAIEAKKANENYAKELLRISAIVTGMQRDVNRVQYITTETVKYLPDFTREALENYAAVAADGAAQSAGLLASAYDYAEQCSAEVNKVIDEHPGEPQADKPP